MPSYHFRTINLGRHPSIAGRESRVFLVAPHQPLWQQRFAESRCAADDIDETSSVYEGLRPIGIVLRCSLEHREIKTKRQVGERRIKGILLRSFFVAHRTGGHAHHRTS